MPRLLQSEKLPNHFDFKACCAFLNFARNLSDLSEFRQKNLIHWPLDSTSTKAVHRVTCVTLAIFPPEIGIGPSAVGSRSKNYNRCAKVLLITSAVIIDQAIRL